MSAVAFHEGDNRVVLRSLIEAGVRVHSVVCDPPYGLVSVTRRFGGDDAAPARHGKDGAFARASAGFMGSKWDGTGIERDPEFWRLVYEILLPGGYVAAFSSPRTGHWMACAMESAGFVMHPFFGWIYGSGFPKAHSASAAVEKVQSGAGTHWEGWSYGGQATKPALEPIYIAQRPFDQRNGAMNIIAHGVGAINIDGCRVQSEGERGRWPANLLHDGSEQVVAMFPESQGQLVRLTGSEPSFKTNTVFGGFSGRNPFEPRHDVGSAARFFNCFPPDADPVFYHSKASKVDRAGSKHPTVKPVALMQWLCRLLTPAGGLVLDPFAGSGTTGQAAVNEGFDALLIEAEAAFAADIRRRFHLFDDDLSDLIGISPNSKGKSEFPQKSAREPHNIKTATLGHIDAQAELGLQSGSSPCKKREENRDTALIGLDYYELGLIG